MTTNPSNNKPAARKAAKSIPAASQTKRASKAAATNVVELPVTKAPSQRKRKAAAEPAIVVEMVEPAAPKATKRTKAQGTPEAQDGSVGGGVVKSASTITVEQADQLAQLHGQMTNAIEAFEALVEGLLIDGASPSHVGAACGLGNSSIRRILWRRRPELAPK